MEIHIKGVTMKIVIMVSLLVMASVHIIFGMNKLTEQQLSNISRIQYKKFKDCQAYYATLHNGDMIDAFLCTNGPMKGQYTCYAIVQRVVEDSVLPRHFYQRFDSKAFDQLAEHYKTHGKSTK